MLSLEMTWTSLIRYAAWLAMLSHAAAVDDFKSRCSSFRPDIPDAKFEFSEYIAAGQTTNLAYIDPRCGGPRPTQSMNQDVCRITMYLPTSKQSGVQFEAWFPSQWNGRFLATGNGGIGGCIDYIGLSYTAQNGFAAVGSNNGHNGTSGKAFFNNPDVVEDFAGRSLHTIADTGKKVSQQFYDKAHTKSYFFGCSQGGRQGVGAAEKYPGDFDGIVAGSPALDFNALVSWRAHFVILTGTANSTDFIKPEVWRTVIHPEILRQCDEIDGAKDGIIESPERCSFNVAAILCREGRRENCITLNQSYRVYNIFHNYQLLPPKLDFIYPGMNYGNELAALGRLYSGRPFSDSADWFRYVVRKDPGWDPLTYNDSDAVAARELNPFNIRTFPSDLADFRNRKGKLLTYHGTADQQITSLNTLRWYEFLKSSNGFTSEQLDAWARHFQISGMNHCGGGDGAWAIGQGYASPKGPLDPKENVLAAIVAWVEEGQAPETIEGSRPGANGTAQFSRIHCRYPKRNQFKAGALVREVDGIKVTDAKDWECV